MYKYTRHICYAMHVCMYGTAFEWLAELHKHQDILASIAIVINTIVRDQKDTQKDKCLYWVLSHTHKET